MSDHEFENYLTLIGRLLRLNSEQREAIGEELRDHFESRLVELINSGFSHDQAVKIALEEFGDAAGLAAQFSNITQSRNRRMIMRCTIASVIGLAAILVVALSLWPDNHAPKMIDRAAAESDKSQPQPVQKNLDKPAKAEQSYEEHDAMTQAALDDITTLDNLNGTPLSDLMEFIADKHHIPVIFDTAALKDAGLDQTTMQVTMTPLRDIHLKTALYLILSQYNLSYIIRDGILEITTKEKADRTLVTRVYDCQAILSAPDPFPATFVLHSEKRAKDENSTASKTDTGKDAKQDTKVAEQGNKSAGQAANSPADELVNLITTSIAPNTWDSQSGPGSIVYYKGLLIVDQTSAVHEEVAMLLDQISSKTARSAPKPAQIESAK